MNNKARFVVVSVRVVLAVLLTVVSVCGSYFGLSWLGTNSYRPSSVTIIDQDKKYDAAKLKADLEKTQWRYPAEIVVYVGKTPKPESQTIPMPQTPYRAGPLSDFFMTYPKYGYFVPRPGVVLFYYDTEKPYCALREATDSEYKNQSKAGSKLMTQCLRGQVTEADIASALTDYGKGTTVYSNISKTWVVVGTVGITLLCLPLIVLLVSLVGAGAQAENKTDQSGTEAPASGNEAKTGEKSRKYREPFSIRTFQIVVSVGMLFPVVIGFVAAGIAWQRQGEVVGSSDVYAKAPAYLKGVSDELGTSDAGKLYHPENVQIVDVPNKKFIADPQALKDGLSKLGFTKKISLTVMVTDGLYGKSEDDYYKKVSNLLGSDGPFKPYEGKANGLQTKPGHVVLLYTPCLEAGKENCQGVYQRFHLLGSPWPDQNYVDSANDSNRSSKIREEFDRYTQSTELMNLSALAKPVGETPSVHLDKVIWETAVGLANTERGIYNEQALWNQKTSVAATAFCYALGISGVVVLVLFVGFLLLNNKLYRRMVNAGGAVVRGNILDAKPGFKESNAKETVSVKLAQVLVGFVVFAIGIVGSVISVWPVEEKATGVEIIYANKNMEQKVAPLSVTVRDPAGLFDAEAVKKAAEDRKYPVPIHILVTSESCSSESIGTFGNEQFFMGPGEITALWQKVTTGQKPEYKTLGKASAEYQEKNGTKFVYSDSDVRPNVLVLCVDKTAVYGYQNANIRPVKRQPEIENPEFDFGRDSTRASRTEMLVKMFTGSDPSIALIDYSNK